MCQKLDPNVAAVTVVIVQFEGSTSKWAVLKPDFWRCRSFSPCASSDRPADGERPESPQKTQTTLALPVEGLLSIWTPGYLSSSTVSTGVTGASAVLRSTISFLGLCHVELLLHRSPEHTQSWWRHKIESGPWSSPLLKTATQNVVWNQNMSQLTSFKSRLCGR